MLYGRNIIMKSFYGHRNYLYPYNEFYQDIRNWYNADGCNIEFFLPKNLSKQYLGEDPHDLAVLAARCAGLIQAINAGESVEPFLFNEWTPCEIFNDWTPLEIDPDYEKKEIARKA